MTRAAPKAPERFTPERELGRGASAAVWAARDSETGQLVALKLPLERDRETLARFRREALILSTIIHPNVPRFVEAAHDGSFIAMELAEGESLGTLLARERSLALQTAASLLVQVVSAVGFAHSHGILHRDVKPENVIVSSSGSVRVLDFGIAKLHRSSRLAESGTALTRTGAILGTPYTMAPEQAFGEPSIDHRADIWAIGVCLYQMLSGRRPVDGADRRQIYRVLMTGAIAPLSTVAPFVPLDVAKLVDRMLVVDREQRLPDLSEAHRVLAHHAGVGAPAFDLPSPVRDDA